MFKYKETIKATYNLIIDLFKSQLIIITAKVSFINIISNLLLLFIPIIIAKKYGITRETDSLFLSLSIFSILSLTFSNAISFNIIPYLKSRILEKALFDQFVSKIFSFCILYLGLISIIFSIILYLLWQNFNSYITLLFILILMPVMFLSILNSLWVGVLNALNNFFSASLTSLTRGIFTIGVIFLLGDQMGVISVVVAYGIGELAKSFHLLIFVFRRVKIKIVFIFREFVEIHNFINGGVKHAVSSLISSLSPLVDKVIATFLVAGSISMLDYGDKVLVAFHILLNSFLILYVSNLSSSVAQSYFELRRFKRVLLIGLLTSLALFFVVLIFKNHIVEVIYPKFSSNEQKVIAILVALNMCGFIFNSVHQIINCGVIAFGFTSMLLKVSVLRLTFNIFFDLLLGFKFGIYGIVTATIFTNIICLFIIYFLFNSKVQSFSPRNYTVDVQKI